MRKGIAGLGLAVAALCAWSGPTTTASAQAEAEQSEARFTVVSRWTEAAPTVNKAPYFRAGPSWPLVR